MFYRNMRSIKGKLKTRINVIHGEQNVNEAREGQKIQCLQ